MELNWFITAEQRAPLAVRQNGLQQMCMLHINAAYALYLCINYITWGLITCYQSEVTVSLSVSVVAWLLSDAILEKKGWAGQKESRHGKHGPCGALRGFYASALSRQHHSAFGPGAECSLTPVCRPRFSAPCHSASLMLTPGLCAAACRHVSASPPQSRSPSVFWVYLIWMQTEESVLYLVLKYEPSTAWLLKYTTCLPALSLFVFR